MEKLITSRRNFLRCSGVAASALLASPRYFLAKQAESAPDYTIRIKAAPIEVAPKRILSTLTYDGQFPGPLLRFKEGRQVTVDVFNETETPEQLHWHGQKVSADVDGAAEEGTPYIPPYGKRRLSFLPGPSGLRFYHTHIRGGANLFAGQYTGQVGAERRCGSLRPGSLPRSQGIRANTQPWRRHGSGFLIAFCNGRSS